MIPIKTAELEQSWVDFLQSQGFGFVRLVSGSIDQGLNVVAEKNGMHFAIHCINRSQPVEEGSVWDVLSLAEARGCERSIVMSNARFTEAAQTLAEENRVELWDRVPIPGFWSSPALRIGAAAVLILGALLLTVLLLAGRSARRAKAEVSVSPTPAATAAPTAAAEATPTPSPSPEPSPEPAYTLLPSEERWDSNYPDNRFSYIPASVKEILGLLHVDPAAAAERYDGQYVKLSGFLSRTDPEAGSYTIEQSQGQDSQETIFCVIANDDQLWQLKALPAHKYVIVYGKCFITDEGCMLFTHSLGS